MNIDSRSRVFILLVIMILFWGSSFVVVKLALNEGLSPIAIATYRFLVAGGIFLILLVKAISVVPTVHDPGVTSFIREVRNRMPIFSRILIVPIFMSIFACLRKKPRKAEP